MKRHLDAMCESRDATRPSSPLEGISGRTLAEHEAIFDALSTRDSVLSQAAALLHVSNIEQWLREHLRSGEPLPFGTTARK